MKFEIGDYVTPTSAFIGSGATFKIVDYNLEKDCYTLKFVAGTISHGSKENVECAYWKAEELKKIDFATTNTATDSSIALNLDGLRVSTELPLINIEEDKIKLPKLGIEIKENGVFGVDWSITNNEKENDNMNKILEIYKERQLKKYEDYYNKELIKIKSEDEIQKIVEEMKSQIKTIFENEDREFKTEIYLNEYTEKTLKDLEDLGIARKLFEKSIDLTIEEVEALLNMADSFEEKQKILKNYNILDKKGILID